MTLKMLDTFAGIGGFSYASKYLIDPGIETTGFVEIDPFCQKVLSKNFPNIPIYDDITKFTAKPFQYDIISGGFPCQDISVAGRQKGITKTTRSGLFYELIRVIRMVRPKYVILENVSAILNNGLDIVLAELYEAGYDAEWATFPASLIGAAHQRDRFWLVGKIADSNDNGSSRTEKSRSIKETNGGSEERENIIIKSEGSSKSRDSRDVQLPITDTKSSTWDENEVEREHGKIETQEIFRDRDSSGDTRESSNSISKGMEERISGFDKELQETGSTRSSDSSSDRSTTSNPDSLQRFELLRQQPKQGQETQQGTSNRSNRQSTSSSNGIRTQSKNERYNPSWKVPVGNGETRQTLSPKWRGYVSEPCLRRGDDGLRGRMDRLKALGNSVVPQCAAIPLQRVIQLEREQQ